MQLYKIFISAGLAFAMSIGVAMLIETFGGAVGSVIGTVPSTIIPAAYIIMTDTLRTKEQRVESIIACLFGMFSTNILFMPSWKVIPPRLPKKWRNGVKVLVTTLLSTAIWFIGAITLVCIKMGMDIIGVSIWFFGLGIILVCISCGVCLCWNLPPTPAGKNTVKWFIHLCRGIAASIAIFISGVLSQSGAGVAAGAMSTFPAIFGTTMVSVSLAQGADVTTGAIGPLLLGGMSVSWFTMTCALFFYYTEIHAAWCCLIAFCVSVCFWNIPVYFFIRWRRDVSAKKRLQIQEMMKESELVEVIKEEKTKVNDNSDSPGKTEEEK